MLRRLVPFRRMLAVALAGAALGACSGAAKDATAPSTQSQPDLASASSRAFALSTASVSFTYAGVFTPTTQTVNASGLITLAMGYVLIGKIQYQPSNIKNWLTVRMRPRGTIIEISFTPRFVPGVDLGGVTALVPISVPGASNNPQIIRVSVGEDLLGCPISGTLAFPSLNPLVGELVAPPDCLLDIYGDGDLEYPDDYTPIDAYAVTVPGNTTFTVMLRGVSSDAGDMRDPYLFLWDPAVNEILEESDDDGGGIHSPFYDSRIVWNNESSQPKLYYLLASYCCGYRGPGDWGSYTIDIYNGVFWPPYESGVAPNASASVMEPMRRSAVEARKYAASKQQ